MPKAIKYSLITIVTLIIILIIALVVAVNVINPNKFKPLISKKVYEATGRELTMTGDLKWSIFPLGININDVSLSNSKDFAKQTFLSVQHASVYARLLPLIVGKVEVSSIKVNNLTINLMKNKAGQNNWAMTSNSPTEKVDTSANKEAANNQTVWGKISIPSINAKNITVTWDDQQTKQQSEIRNLNLKISNVQSITPFPVSGSLGVSSNQPNIKGQITFKGQVALNTAAKQFSLKDFNINSQWQGDDLPNKKMTATGNITAKITDNSIDINPLQLKIGQDDLTGKLNVQNFKQPTVQFDIASNRLNLDPYLSILKKHTQEPAKTKQQQQKSASHQTTQANKQASQDQLLTTLRQLNVNGNINIKQLTVMKANIQDIQSQIKAKNGMIAITPIRAKLYQGTFDGSIHVDARSSLPKISVKEDLKGVQVNGLIKDMYGSDLLSGVANANANITTAGFEQSQLNKNMNGQFKLSLNQGALKGIDISYYMNVLDSLMKKQTKPSASKEKQTKFHHAGASGIIKQGVISSQDMLLSGPGIYVSGKGNANLNNQQLDLSLRAAKAKGSKPSLPIKITGTFQQPKIRPEYKAVLGGVVNQLKDGSTETVKKPLNRLKSLFN